VGVLVPHKRNRKRATLPRREQSVAPVVVTFTCPTCREPHRTTDTADERALRILRGHALDELACAVRAGADDDHVSEVLAVIQRCDERLGAE
jgi:hypothetical protein